MTAPSEAPPSLPAPEGPVLAVGRAPGKLILVGEHAVVHGAPAVAMPFHAVQAEARIQRVQGALQLHAGSYGAHHFRGPRDLPEALKGLGACIVAGLAALHLPNECLAFSIGGSVPIGAGLGSSAATACALARALEGLAHHHWPPKQLQGLIEVAERHAHGKPSGVDGAAVAALGPFRFESGGQAQALAVKAGPWLVVADSGTPRDTKAAVAAVAAKRATDEVAFQAALRVLGQQADAVVRGLEAGDAPALGEAFEAAATVLRGWGLEAEAPARLMQAMRQAGAHGAKPTGAGCGGCVVAVVGSETEALALQAAAEAAGAKAVWCQSLGEMA